MAEAGSLVQSSAPAAAERQWNDFLAAKQASRREFVARQLARSPEQRLAAMVSLSRRALALRPGR